MTEDEFRNLCVNHDLTYQYSDDGAVWRRGNERLAVIQAAARELTRETAVRIWNETVDTKVSAGYRESFYWTV
jgi:hypothetical protein